MPRGPHIDALFALSGRVAMVTGGAQNLGLDMAEALAEAGADLAITSRDPAKAERIAGELGDHAGVEVLAIGMDMLDPASVEAAFATVLDEFGRLDVLVNNAGGARLSSGGVTTDERCVEDFDYVVRLNILGTFLCCRAAVPIMRDGGGGSIVNIASISGLRGSTLRVAYGTSKAAVIHLTRQQAAELGEHGVRANCVAPGPVRTKLAQVHTPEIVAAYHDSIPLNRYGSEDEIASVIVFLCSGKASYVTGQVLAADGGFESTGVGLPALRAEGAGQA